MQEVESSRSWWSTLTFSWVNPLLQTGSQRQLEQADLLVVPSEMAPQLCCGRLWRCWEQECACDRQGGPSLLWAVFHAYGRKYLFLGIFQVLYPYSYVKACVRVNLIVVTINHGVLTYESCSSYGLISLISVCTMIQFAAHQCCSGIYGSNPFEPDSEVSASRYIQ